MCLFEQQINRSVEKPQWTQLENVIFLWYPHRPLVCREPRAKYLGGDTPAVAFLRAATASGVNGVVVAIDPDKEQGEAGQIAGCAYTVANMSKVSAFIEDRSDCNIYWSINPTKAPLNKKPKKPDIAAMRWVHLDLDDLSDEALERVRAYHLPPTMIVKSGGGYNVYWALSEPVQANGNIEELEGANRGVIMDLGADPGTQNLDRILRVPGTMNWPTKAKKKRGRTPVEAVLLDHQSDRTYTLDQFRVVSIEEWETYLAQQKAGEKKTKEPKGGDRSRELLRKISADMQKGLDDDELHEKYDTHEHAKDQSDPARAVQRCIDLVRKEEKDVIARLNRENALIWVGGDLSVMWPDEYDKDLPRLCNVTDARTFWKKIQRGKVNPVDAWLASHSRKEYKGFTFKPGADDTGDKFNLFRGWGIEPNSKASCALFLAHMRDIICNEDEDLYDYVIQWFANSIQKPMKKPGTALASGAGQGAGRGLIVRYVRPIYGVHMRQVNSSEQLLGKFDAWLAGKLLVFGDEAAWPGDKRGLDKLKSKITEEIITVEEKNIPTFVIDNYANYFFATNKKHSAHAEFDDRRMVPLPTNNKVIGDKAYWQALEAERQGQGPAALLHHLLNVVELTRDLRTTPKTQTLLEQKLLSLEDVGMFVRELLLKESRKLDIGYNADTGGHQVREFKWGDVITTDTLHRFYLDFMKRNNRGFPKSIDALGVELPQFFTMTRREARASERQRLGLGSKRIYIYALPPLTEARASFETKLDGKMVWTA